MEYAEKRNNSVRDNRFKKIFAVLIILLLVLTFFSKSLYNYRLPVVSAVLPKQGKLAFTVEKTSEFAYAHVSSVYADVDGRVKEILVEKGEKVKAGECLMRIERNETGEMQDITAEENGIITHIGVSKGMYVSSMQNTVLYETAEKSNEWVCSMIISEEESAHISMESVPAVYMVNQNETVQGKIQDIIAYASESIEGYKVDIAVDVADVSSLAGMADVLLAGERVNITVKEDGVLYDTLIPAAALRKDAEGYYVLVLQQNDSVLGEGYKARRMSVDLLDSDETYCAVRGLPADEHVITAASDEIAEDSSVYYEGDD